MSQVDDGGPAFPSTCVYEFHNRDTGNNEVTSDVMSGMSLRDWFAGQALTSGKRLPDQQEPQCAHDVAEQCYLYADAMLAERAKSRDGAV